MIYKTPVPAHRPLALSLQMVADELDTLLWDFTIQTEDEARVYSCRIYVPGQSPEIGVLYILPEDCANFPCDQYPYLSIGSRSGKAEHICVFHHTLLDTISELTRIFQHFRDFEAELNWILTHNGSLNDLCAAATIYLQNPVYIHDSLFSILAMPCRVEGMLDLEYHQETGKYFIPLWLVDDFKCNEDYQNTLHRKQAAIWGTNQYPYHMRSLYVNIWDAIYFRARLLVTNSMFSSDLGTAW